MSSLEARRLSHLESAIRAAFGEQIVTIERLVAEAASMRAAEVVLARRTEAIRTERRCPHCRTGGAHLHGKDKNDRQRFRCRVAECRRSFNILTGTPMARARKPEKWGQYLSHMTDHRSVIGQTARAPSRAPACMGRHQAGACRASRCRC